MILFSIVGIMAAACLVYAIRHTKKLHRALAGKGARNHIPTAIQAFVLVAQASELVKVVEHATIVNITAAGLLLAMVVATKSGTERQLR